MHADATAAVGAHVGEAAARLERRRSPAAARDLLIAHLCRRFAAALGVDPPAELERDPPDLTADERAALARLDGHDWRAASPVLLGTVLERALSPSRRRALGAHYTPEAHIRRLVERTIVAPLRAERAACSPAEFRRRLAAVRVLDPACGSGNFLVVALIALMRLEDELGPAADVDDHVHPGQLHGLELDPCAARIAGLTVWIAWLQRQVATGRRPRAAPPPAIRVADALLAHAAVAPARHADGRGARDARAARHPRAEQRQQGVRVPAWPEADFIVGNPPFVGNKRMCDALGAGYVAALRAAYPAVPASADLVMLWWQRCAELLQRGTSLRRFGLVTTSSVHQPLNRPVIARALAAGVRLVYAIADHPWFDAGAAVRIAMTVAARDDAPAELGRVVDESDPLAPRVEDTPVAEIHADLSAGPDLQQARPLRANAGVCFQGITLVGAGFRLAAADLERLGVSPDAAVVRPYLIGRDLVRRPAARWVIDLHGLSLAEADARHPRLVEHLTRTVKPQREAQNDRQRRERWWQFGRSGSDLRAALAGLGWYIATARTARHRVFTRVPATTLPDTRVVAIAREDFSLLALLSSRVHLAWALRVGGRLGAGNDPTYNHRHCFEAFPLPRLDAAPAAALRRAGERLDEHRRARQAEHPALTLTATYNVLAKLRAGRALVAAEQRVRAWSQADALRELHAEIDALALAAYGWPDDLDDDGVIARLVALNRERAAAETSPPRA